MIPLQVVRFLFLTNISLTYSIARLNSHLDVENVEVRARRAPHDAIVGDPLLLVEPRREPVRALRVRQVSGDDDRAWVHVRIQVSAEGLNTCKFKFVESKKVASYKLIIISSSPIQIINEGKGAQT